MFVLVLHVVKSISLHTTFNNLSVFQGAFFIFAYLIFFPAGRLVIFTDDLGPFQTSNFSCAESNVNEKNLLFSLICIRFGT